MRGGGEGGDGLVSLSVLASVQMEVPFLGLGHRRGRADCLEREVN